MPSAPPQCASSASRGKDQPVLRTPSPPSFKTFGQAFSKLCPKQGARVGIHLWTAGRFLSFVSPPRRILG